MGTRNKLIGLVIGILISSQGVANADFSEEFAPSKWTYSDVDTSQYGPSGSISETTMTLTSADYPGGAGDADIENQAGVYSIVVPINTGIVTFDYSYYTGDVSNSSYDMATYTVNGAETNIVPTNIPSLGSSSGSVSINLTGLAGTTFSISQKCTDCVLGTATTTITKFVAKFNQFSNLNVLSSEESPTISSDATGYTCKPGKFSLLSKGINRVTGSPTSIAYTLIVGGVRVSSVSSDNWSVMSRSSVAESNNSVTGTASLTSATWAFKGAADSSARCEVVALQDGVTSLSGSK
jgi:hypothetical protein